MTPSPTACSGYSLVRGPLTSAPPKFRPFIEGRGDTERASIERALSDAANTLISGGGTKPTTNRTFWPTTGGAVAFQPGWFQGHSLAQLYINLGYGTDGPDGGPPNMTFNMIPPFQLLGPSKGPYPGTVCLPQVPLPAGASVKPGDNATIQVVELAQHGAALYSVSPQYLDPPLKK